MMVTGGNLKIWHRIDHLSLDKTEHSDFSKLVYVSDFNLVFIIYNGADKCILDIRSYYFPEGLNKSNVAGLKEDIPQLDKLVNMPGKIIYDTPSFTLIPDDFSAPGLDKDVFELNFPEEERTNIITENIGGLKNRLVYNASFNLEKIKLITKTTTFTSAPAVYLKAVFRQKDALKKPALFVDFNHDFLKIACFDNEEIKLFNAYPYSTKEEALYNVLNVAKFCRLDPNEDAFYLSGFVQEDFELYKTLFHYIRYPFFIKPPENLLFDERVKSLPAHIYYNALATISCE